MLSDRPAKILNLCQTFHSLSDDQTPIHARWHTQKTEGGGSLLQPPPFDKKTSLKSNVF